jgi:hypothetical protein
MTSFSGKIVNRILLDLKDILPKRDFDVVEKALSKPEFTDTVMKEARRQIEATRIISPHPVIVRFEEMINDPSTTEPEMQRLFEKNCWILGPHYERVEPQKRVGESHILDLRLKGGLDLCEIVELKRPNEKLFVRRRRGLSKSVPLVEALEQLIDYREFYIEHHDYILSVEGSEVYKPRGSLIIGRTYPDEIKRLELENSYLKDITIKTYDMVLQNATALVSFAEKCHLITSQDADSCEQT